MKREILENCINQTKKTTQGLSVSIAKERARLFEAPRIRPDDPGERYQLRQSVASLESCLERVKRHQSLLQHLLTAPAPTAIELGSLVALRNCRCGERDIYLVIPRLVFCTRPSIEQKELCCLSPGALFCRAMLGKKVSEKIEYQNQVYEVVMIE